MTRLLSRAALLWHTLRWLRPVQFYGRAWFRFVRPRPNLSPAPPPRLALVTWRPCARVSSQRGPALFTFLGVTRVINQPADWDRADWPKLWLYNAHYFDDLNADGADARRAWHQALIERWVGENPPVSGSGWEPYPISLRIVNWVKWAATGNVLSDDARQSLAVQARHLRRRLEIHLLGNHLWANAKALVFAGTFFIGEEALSWRQKGLALLERELAEQILLDGGHFERSPMYHAILLEDVLDLIQLDRVYPGVLPASQVGSWRTTALRMLRWLRVMTHPDGGIALFNDAALGVAPSWAELTEYASGLGIDLPVTSLALIEVLPQSGYVRLQQGPAVLFADVGEVGPDYLPGHAHADTLSFELSLHGRRVLVNGGTSTYEADALRLQQRGTSMHNAVAVDGTNSSEVWSSFRVGRRARPRDVEWRLDGDVLVLSAAHDGYLCLPGKVLHRREWCLDAVGLRITDTLAGTFGEGRAFFRLATDAVVEWEASAAAIVRWPPLGEGGEADTSVQLTFRATGEQSACEVAGTWHPRFGSSLPCRVLQLDLAPHPLVTEFSWK